MSTQTNGGSVAQLRGIAKSYVLGKHRVQALKSVDLDVLPGQMMALTGPSGSGKSTLLNICGLIDAPDAGSCTLIGRDIAQMDERARTLVRRDAIGFVFQSFNLVPVMDVTDNVGYPLFLAGESTRETRRKVDAMLERVGLTEHARHRPDELSGGQRQRVAIARALVKSPRLVIADEPTANLDSHTAEQVLDLMRELCHQEGAAFLIASHDTRLTARCDRVVALLDGEIQ